MHDKDLFEDSVEPNHHVNELGKNALTLAELFTREQSVSRHPSGQIQKELPLSEEERTRLFGLIENLTIEELQELIKLIVTSQAHAYRRTVLRVLDAHSDVKKLPPINLK